MVSNRLEISAQLVVLLLGGDWHFQIRSDGGLFCFCCSVTGKFFDMVSPTSHSANDVARASPSSECWVVVLTTFFADLNTPKPGRANVWKVAECKACLVPVPVLCSSKVVLSS